MSLPVTVGELIASGRDFVLPFYLIEGIGVEEPLDPQTWEGGR